MNLICQKPDAVLTLTADPGFYAALFHGSLLIIVKAIS